MKKLVLILCLSMAFIAGAFAQDNFENNPKVKQLRKQFYEKELQFTATESAAFWPQFQKMQKEQRKLRKSYKADAKVDLMTDEEAKAHLENLFVYEEKKAALKKEYFAQFAKIIPVRKVAKIEETERKFKRGVLKKVRENRRKRN